MRYTSIALWRNTISRLSDVNNTSATSPRQQRQIFITAAFTRADLFLIDMIYWRLR